MNKPDAHELDCLTKIASAHSNIVPPCAHDVLHRLESLGLIEQAPGIGMPLEMAHTSYRLTHAGRVLLRQQEEP